MTTIARLPRPATSALRPEPVEGDRFAAIPAARCWTLLGSRRSGRLAWTGDDGPEVVPVSYRLHHGAVVVRSSYRGPLAQLARGRRAAFEIDALDEQSRTGWSVVATGHVRAVLDLLELVELDDLDLESWAPGPCRLFLSLQVDSVRGQTVST